MNKFKYLVIALNLIFQSTAYANSNTENWTPGIAAKVDIQNGNYQFEVSLEVPNNHNMLDFKKQMIEGNIIAMVSDLVKEASFSKLTPSSQAAIDAENSLMSKRNNNTSYDTSLSPQAEIYNFSLSISHTIAGTFAHRFICRDISLSSSQWHQVCEQTSAENERDKSILTNTKIDILCVNPDHMIQDGMNIRKNSRCNFNIMGNSSDLRVGIRFANKTVKNQMMIGTFVREYVTFVSHLGLILNKNASSIKVANELFKNSTYKRMVDEFKKQFEESFAKSQDSVKFEATLEVSNSQNTFNAKQSNVVFHNIN